MADTVTIEDLRRVIRTTPIIDNHAHNLLRLDELKREDFLSATSEATGAALGDHTTTLPHFRAVRQLRELYDLPKDADWDAILAKRQELLNTDADGLIKKCLIGTHTILIDDGLIGSFEPYNWHDQFVTSPCKRIVRIEAIASEILYGLHKAGKLPIGVAIADQEACSLAWIAFITAFEEAIVAYLEDDEVVGFKSVICYRTGLDIEVGSDLEVSETALRSFARHFLPHMEEKKFRVQTKGMNDALVISVCKLLQASYKQDGVAKPLQFHTGLGDNDISLLDSNPAVMQDFINIYPDVPIVLLHSSYPYTREAGYLAMAYKNVYLDLGEVFPQVSRDGQEQIIRQALEITPTSNLLWSTDGHHFPETYWLANRQGRQALETVFCEYVEHEDMSATQAIQAVRDILFENSNRLYELGLQSPKDDEVRSGSDQLGTAIVAPLPVLESGTQQQLANVQSMVSAHGIRFVFVQWFDYMAQMRTRCLTVKAFNKLMTERGGRLSISKGNLGTTPNDHQSPICEPVGSIWVEPDLASFRLMQQTQTTEVEAPTKDTATVMARFTDEAGLPLDICPRARLQQLVQDSEQSHKINFLVGFEIEVTFCRMDQTGENEEKSFVPFDKNHAWGTFSDEQYYRSLKLLKDIVDALEYMGIDVEQFHSEAGAGQYEFVLPPLPPVQAIDTLAQAKQCIQHIATLYGCRATCHPMPFSGVGTGAHVHISLNSESLTQVELKNASDSFAAQLLQHIPAICAITMPRPVSYGRVADNSWTGGTWVAWGTNNRETPLRRVNDTRWEVRCVDGFANMYLVLSAVLATGLSGVQQDLTLRMRDCQVNPSKLDENGRKELGIVQSLPRTLEESLTAYKDDLELHQLLGHDLAMNWLAVEIATQDMLNQMSEREQRFWLMERY